MTTLLSPSARTRAYRLLVVVLALTLAVAALVSPAASVQASPALAPAASILVNDAGDNTTGSNGLCTLREAINNANADSDGTGGDCTAGSGADIITFNIPSGGACSPANTCTITLGSTLPLITTNVTIDGAPNSGRITLNGGGSHRIMDVSGGGTLTVNALTLANGHGTGGGAIRNQGGTVNVTNSTFRDNTTVSNVGSGGAINNFSGTVNVANSTFFNNGTGSTVNGGAIWNNAILNVTSTTFSGNQAGGNGSAIYNVRFGTLTLKNSILADGTGVGDCFNETSPFPGTVTGNNNLIESTTNACGFTDGVGGNIVGTDPNLAALADNGGPTQTMALNSGSAAIDGGDDAVCAAAPVNNLDQRGFTRPQGAHCDIGAYEYNASLAVTLAGFEATAQAEHVLVTWETVSELENAGFNLYRTTSAEPPTPADLLTYVPSQAPGSTQGFAYSYQDQAVTPGATYWYWLADVDFSGITTMHGPVSVVVTAPTAVTLSGLEAAADRPAVVAWPMLLAALISALAVAGALYLRRSEA